MPGWGIEALISRWTVLRHERRRGGLKGAPILFVGDVVAWADKAKHVRYLAGFIEFYLIGGFHRSKPGTEDFGEILLGGLVSFLFGVKQAADTAQLSGVEPETTAGRTLVDLDFLLDAGEVTAFTASSPGGIGAG